MSSAERGRDREREQNELILQRWESVPLVVMQRGPSPALLSYQARQEYIRELDAKVEERIAAIRTRNAADSVAPPANMSRFQNLDVANCNTPTEEGENQ